MARQAPDGCLVPAAPFSELVRDFVQKWNRDRPQPGGQFGIETTSTPIRAIAWLSGETGLSESTIENLYGTRRSVTGEMLPGRYAMIELRIADAVAVALDAPYLFADPRVEGKVVPNPFAKATARAACCSGSDREAAAA